MVGFANLCAEARHTLRPLVSGSNDTHASPSAHSFSYSHLLCSFGYFVSEMPAALAALRPHTSVCTANAMNSSRASRPKPRRLLRGSAIMICNLCKAPLRCAGLVSTLQDISKQTASLGLFYHSEPSKAQACRLADS